MQTRKKSVSLVALGIAIPGTSSNRASHRSPSSSSSNTTANPNSNPNNQSSSSLTENPPAKRLKRSHTLSSAASSTSNPSPALPPKRHASTGDRQQSLNATPPPSPGGHRYGRVDTQGIKDDVVVGVLEQLESTGNRPHLIKELAAVLGNKLKVVQSSSNPIAIISSRLTNYLRRPWTALAPCPLAKEQINIHPRRVYFYLNTMPRQPIPEYAETAATGMRIISPSVSSGPDEEVLPVEDDPIQEDTLSDSLEFDLTSQDISFDQAPPFPALAFPDTASTLAQHESSLHGGSNPTPAMSPPLEHDEREFTQTASVMQARKQSEQQAGHEQQQQQEQQQRGSRGSSLSTPESLHDTTMSPPAEPSFPSITPASLSASNSVVADADTNADTPSAVYDGLDEPLQEQETEETAALRNREAAAALFGQTHNHLGTVEPGVEGSSPMLRPTTAKDHPSTTTTTELNTPDAQGEDIAMVMENSLGAWGELAGPEHVALSELDDLLGGF